MTEKYTMQQLRQLSIIELSSLIGYDYRDFKMAGGTLEDVYQIVNHHKTLEDVIGVSAIDPRDLSEEELSMSQRRQFKGNLVAIGCLLLFLILTIVIFLAISNAMF